MGISIQQVIDRIVANIPSVHLADTVDSVKIGDPGQNVSGAGNARDG